MACRSVSELETVRVDICYRPLRIAWAIKTGDIDAFRAAARMSFAFWGGRFNPIVVVDQAELARELIDAFRADVIIPVGESDEVKQFPKKFPHLIAPFMLDRDLFPSDGVGGARSYLLDINNALVHVADKPQWKAHKERGIRLYTWSKDDPLSDVFLMHFGEYPSKDDIKLDYRAYLHDVSGAEEIAIGDGPLQGAMFKYPTISFVSRFGLEQHYSVRRHGWDTPGFFSGDASNFDDLVCYWNLRASDISLLFVDVKQLERYGESVHAWGEAMRERVSHRRHEFARKIGVWVREQNTSHESRRKTIEEVAGYFKEEDVKSICSVGSGSWNGRNIMPPMMYLGSATTLGVIDDSSKPPQVSFALGDKPFSDDAWFFTQLLVASLSFIGGLYRDEEHILVPPYIPELNEFYSRNIHFDYDKLRSESERIGVIVDACDSDVSIRALPVSDLVERVFGLAGFESKLSSGGLIARQLITQLGGVDGARAFKIPGVRRLLKTHGPMAAFTKKSAVDLIASKDPENPTASFADYEQLYGGHHPINTKLDPQAVFAYLVEKGLFRLGAELSCPHCRMSSWTALDVLTQRLICELCGREFDATRQLVDGKWHYRRSGVLGAERNAQGAIPVVLTLQQFRINLSSLRGGVYLPSVDLVPKKGRGDLPKCESDFVWIIPQPYPEKTVVMIGECKDRGSKKEAGGKKGTIDADDINNLRRLADALPRHRFSTFIVLAKLCPFTPEEIELAKTLNDDYRRRVILLTHRELEPYHIYERTQLLFKNIQPHAISPEDLANNTALMYFNN
jgi:hypothetical protein